MMPEDREEIPAEIELSPEKPRETSVTKAALVIAGIVLAVSVAVFGVVHADKVSSSQAAQIQALDKSNTHLAGELATVTNQLSQMSAKLSATQSEASATNPDLITCADLRHMDLTTTTGGSVSAVPGSVSLDQGSVPLPEHCRHS